MASDRPLTQYAERNLGVFTVADALDLGVTKDQLRRRVQSNRYLWRDHDVLVAAGTPPNWFQSVLTAVLSAGHGAAASHRTAAYLHGLMDRRPEVIEVIVPRWDRVHRHFIIHESKDLQPTDKVQLRRIPVTTAVRTVVDLGAVAPGLVESALDTGLHKRLFEVEDVVSFVNRVARKGRRGVGVIRPFLEARWALSNTTESALEDLGLRVLVRGGCPPPETQVEILDERGNFVCRADTAYRQAKLRIEWDGERYHTERGAFRTDRRQQNQTELLGWRTLRYTWWDLVANPDRVVAEIKAALGSHA